MTRVLATYNIKGGVGKTSAAVNLAYLAAARGRAHAALGPRPAGREHLPVPGQAEGEGRRRASSCAARARSTALIKGTDHERLDLLPADFSYRHMDLALDAHQAPDAAARAACSRRSRDEYDYVFLDCPPSISLVSESVFEAADALLVPLIPATLSSRTFEQLDAVVRRRRRSAAGARRSSRWSTRRKRLHREVMDELLPASTRRAARRRSRPRADVERMGARAHRRSASSRRAAAPRSPTRSCGTRSASASMAGAPAEADQPAARSSAAKQPVHVLVVVVVHHAGADAAVGLEAQQGGELERVVVAVPDGHLVAREVACHVLRRAAFHGQHERGHAVAGAPCSVRPSIADRPSTMRANSASSCARIASKPVSSR